MTLQNRTVKQKLQKKAPSGAKASPLVMAYIGSDDPHRGDSKAAIGLSRIVARMIKGEYVYVDQAMLNQSFPTLNKAERLSAYLKKNGEPDVVIGTRCQDIESNCKNKKMLAVGGINEIMSCRANHSLSLVSHNLSTENLEGAKIDFKSHYPEIKGPLIGVMMGGNFTWEIKDFAKKLVKIAGTYPQATLFICPSRRTESEDKKLSNALKLFRFYLSNPLVRTFNKITSGSDSTDGSQTHKIWSNNITIIRTDYNKAIKDYNPYLGLLASADHLIVAGQSYSMVSEALFTGKNIYACDIDNGYDTLKAKGYIVDFEEIAENEQLPTRAMPRLDLTETVAKNIAKDYRCVKAGKNVSPYSTYRYSVPKSP